MEFDQNIFTDQQYAKLAIIAQSLSFSPVQFGDVLKGDCVDRSPLVPFSHRKLRAREEEALERAKRFIMDQNVKSVLKKQQDLNLQSQALNMKRTQALMLLSRIYIGSISYEINEELIKQYFSPFGAIKSVSLSYDNSSAKHKGYCFLEFELPEAAQLALEQMNGFPLGGRNLKVGRPSNIPQAQNIIDEVIGDVTLVNRIYVANVHPDLSEDDLKMVFEAFGEIIYCKLQADYANSVCKHRGFGYIEYSSSQSAIDAVTSMNNFDLGGKFLRVGKAMTPPSQVNVAAAAAPTIVNAKLTTSQIGNAISNGVLPVSSTIAVGTSPVARGVSPKFALPAATAAAAAEISAKLIELEAKGFSNPDAFSGNKVSNNSPPVRSTSQKYSGSRGSPPLRSRLMVLKNIADLSEIGDELENDVLYECERYGPVKKVISANVRNNAEVFVLFDRDYDASDAVKRLNGRYFDKRKVTALIIPESELAAVNRLS